MRHIFERALAFSVLMLAFCSLAHAQDSEAKLHEEMARTQATAARLNEANARLTADSAVINAEVIAQIQAGSKRAQEAADRAQDAANKAKQAADSEANSTAAASAIKAQEYANEAQDYANRAQQVLNVALRGSNVPKATFAKVGDGETTTTDPPLAAKQNDNALMPASAIRRASAAAAAAPDFTEFVNRRFDNVVRSRIGPKNNTNQNETPSISANSTSLVEKSSVGDLISMALNPFGRANNNAETNPTSSSTTVSAYALKAFASGRDPLDPTFYTNNRHWRKVSFTYGVDYTKDQQTGAQVKSNIYGFKLLPYDRRDVSDPANQEKLRRISRLFYESGPAVANISRKIKRDIFEALSSNHKLPPAIASKDGTEAQFDAFIESLRQDNIVAELASALGGEDVLIKLVDDIISKGIDPEIRFHKAEQEAFDAIRRKPQVAFTFLTRQREQNRPNDYVGGLTMDLGVAQRWNVTFNGLFNYIDNKLTGDSRGGTFATELQIPLNAVDQLSDRVPWMFSFAASGKWLTKEGPRYQGQLKLTLPVPHLPGVELPLSVSFANRKEFLAGKESKIRGHVGFTFDIAKLLTALKNQVATPLFR